MKRIYHINSLNPYKAELPCRTALFCIWNLMEVMLTGTRIEKKGKPIQPLTDRRTTGQSWQMLLFGRQGQALQVFGKIILTVFRYFSKKPCLAGSICRKALVVQRAAKARIFTIKLNEL